MLKLFALDATGSTVEEQFRKYQTLAFPLHATPSPLKHIHISTGSVCEHFQYLRRIQTETPSYALLSVS